MSRSRQHVSFRQKAERLRQQVSALERRATALRNRLDTIGTAQRKPYALVDASKCNGCRICEELCPADAIRVTYVASVNSKHCTGCGVCVENCPRDAIRLRSG